MYKKPDIYVHIYNLYIYTHICISQHIVVTDSEMCHLGCQVSGVVTVVSGTAAFV